MKKILFFLLLILAITLEISFSPFWKTKGPDLVLVFILLWIVSADFNKIWPWLILIGVGLDFLSALPFGIICLSLIVACFAVDWLKKNIFSQTGFPIACLLVVAGVLLYNLFLAGLGRLFNLDLFFNLRYLPVELLFDLLATAVFYGVLAEFLSFPV